MLLNYKYKWNRKNTQLSMVEKRRKGVVYKRIVSNNICYIIVKYIDPKGGKALKYKVKMWMSTGHYKSLCLCNNPRGAINYIKDHSENTWFLYA